MTIPGFDGDVSVDDRASECLTAIARTYEEGLAHLEFLSRLWSEPITPAVPALPALPVMTPIVDEPAEPVVLAEPIVAEPIVVAEPVVAEPVVAAEPITVIEPAAPLLADEPAMLPMAVVAADVPAPVSADAPTAVELPVVALPEVLDETTESHATEADDANVLLFAEAATAEIPVQAAA